MLLYLYMSTLDHRLQIKDHLRTRRYLKRGGNRENNGMYNGKAERETNWRKKEN